MKPLASLLIVSFVAAWAPIGATEAQDDSASRSRFRDVDLKTRIYQLKKADLYEAYETLKHIYNTRNVAMLEQSDSLVVRDTSAILDEISELIEQMEQQSNNGPSPRETAQVIRLENRDPNYMASMLNEMFHSTSIRADFDSRQIVIKGDDAQEISEIVQMIAQLDVQVAHGPKRVRGNTFSITVDFISATVGAKSDGDLPDNLKGVGAALRKQGLGNLSVYGHLMVRTQENEEFESKGVVRSGDDDSAVSFLRIRGNAEMIDGQAQLRIESILEVPITQTRQDREGKTHTTTSYEDFGLSTTTTVPLADYLVLGAMPASTEDSDTILLVIQVTTD